MSEPKTEQETRTGELLVQHGYITRGQLERALEAQGKIVGYKPLGEVCKDMGLISRTALRDFLAEQGKHLRLGDLLLKMGIIAEPDLLGGLKIQKDTKERLGEILMRKAGVSKETLARALGIQLTIPTMEPDVSLVDMKIFHSVNSRFLSRKRVIPVCHKQVEGVITVIMENPLDQETILDLEKIFGEKVEPAVLSRGNVEHMLDVVLRSDSVPGVTRGSEERLIACM